MAFSRNYFSRSRNARLKMSESLGNVGGRLIEVEEKDGNWCFDVSESKRDEIDTIIRLRLDPAK